MEHLAVSRDAAVFREIETRIFPNRSFEVWDYLVSHKQLIIRSPGTEPGQLHIDLYFRGVHYLQCPSWFVGLSITQPTGTELQRFERSLGPSRFERPWLRVLESGGERHFVVAALLKVGETDYPLMVTPLVHPS